MYTILRHLVWPKSEFRMQVWNALRAARCKCRTQKLLKSRHLGTIRQICRAISSQRRHVSTIGKKGLLSSDMFSTRPHNMVNFGPLVAEICWRVWGTPANFNGFRVFAALLHGTPLLGVSQTLRRWTEGATYIRQGGHHVGHWPAFLVLGVFVGLTDASAWLAQLAVAIVNFSGQINTGSYSITRCSLDVIWHLTVKAEAAYSSVSYQTRRPLTRLQHAAGNVYLVLKLIDQLVS